MAIEDATSAGWELQGAARERYVGDLFDRIARPYDRLNRVISLGRDRRWRRVAVTMSGAQPGDRVADVGTGTGDLGIAFAQHVDRAGQVVGIDLSAGMLAVAREKRAQADVPWYRLVRGTAAATGLPPAWADVVSMGWVLRNVGDREAAYAEIHRVLKPGGRVVVVDMSRPRGPLRRAGFWMFRHVVMPPLARLSGGDRSAYRYLAGSTDGFPDGPALADELREAGFADVRWRPLMMGAIAVHVATAAE
ncbi:MAG: hypothetical protein CMJ83_11075 [Planctomycetes bacterium]|nr:hypothetical protein [Planctomycetota bacterium]